MGTENKCCVCAYPEVRGVNRAILDRAPYRTIAERFPPLSAASIWRHGARCLEFDPTKTANRRRLSEVIDVYNEMVEQFRLAKSLRQACEEYLSDPVDPSKMNLCPRAEEIQVVYEVGTVADGVGGRERKRIKKTATLAELLRHVKEERPDLALQSFDLSKKTDIRRYALDCIHAVDAILDKFARFEGMYTKDRENTANIEKGLRALTLFMEKNPEATEEQIREAISIVSQGVSVSESELIERAGILLEIEEVQ
jgi:hypothetical protein